MNNKLFVLLAHNSDAGEYNIFRGVFTSVGDAIEGAYGYWGDASKVLLKHFLIKHGDYYYFIVVQKDNPLTQEQMTTMVRGDVVFMCEGIAAQFIIRQVDVNKYKEYWFN